MGSLSICSRLHMKTKRVSAIRHPTRPTFPSKAFQAGGTVDRIQLIPAQLRRVHSLHKAGISYNRKKRKDSTDLFQHHFYFYYDHKFYLFLVNWEEGLPCRVLESHLGVPQMESIRHNLTDRFTYFLKCFLHYHLSQSWSWPKIKLNYYGSSVVSTSHLLGIGFDSQPVLQTILNWLISWPLLCPVEFCGNYLSTSVNFIIKKFILFSSSISLTYTYWLHAYAVQNSSSILCYDISTDHNTNTNNKQKNIIFPTKYNYEDESIIIRSAVASMFLLAALSFSRPSLGVVFFLSQLCRFEVARSVPLSQP